MGFGAHRGWLLASASVMIAGGAHAQSYRFDVEPQAASQGVQQFAEQADVQVLVSGRHVANRRTNAVHGEMTVQQGLHRLLSGTGLEVASDTGGVITLRQARGASGASPQSLRPAGEGTVVGQVVEGVSQRKLAGALVRLAGTTQVAVTDDQGQFRFNGVPAGPQQVQVSFIGFPTQVIDVTVEPGAVSQPTVLFGVIEVESVEVVGSRSGRALALNRERTAENAQTIISSDLLGEFGGQTIAETLRRAPGVTFERDTDTGDGTNISIRGLAPDLNAVKLNGVELPVGNGRGRSASLGNIQTESIDRVTIHKTLLANHDSAGAGGLVEIETRSPLDRPDRFASLSVEGGRRAAGGNDEYSASGTVSGRFGANADFGLSASVQYRERTVQRLAANNSFQFGEYLPLQIDGSPTIYGLDGVHPQFPFPFEPGADGVYANFVGANSDLAEGDTLTATLSAAWTPMEGTSLRLDYQSARLTDTRFQRNGFFGAATAYLQTPVQALGGQERQALTWLDQISTGAAYAWSPDNESRTDVVSFRGETTRGKVQTTYAAGYTEGTTEGESWSFSTYVPEIVGVDPALIRQAELVDPVEGRILSLFGRATPDGLSLPLLSEAGRAYFADTQNTLFSEANNRVSRGSNRRLTGELAVKYDVDLGVLKYVELGTQYERSAFRSGVLRNTIYVGASATPISSLGGRFESDILESVGIEGAFPVLGFDGLQSVISRLPSIAVPFSDPRAFEPGYVVGVESTLDPLYARQRTEEEELATYVQTRFDIGALEVIAGVRFSNIDITAANVRAPQIIQADFTEDLAFAAANTVLIEERASQFNALPRILANYRFSDNLVGRAGYYLSIARPQIGQLSSSSLVTLYEGPFFGPNFNQPYLFVLKGNPDLEPASTHSFDLGLERYDDNLGVAKINLFYKRIDSLLENNINTTLSALEGVDLPDDPRFDAVLANPSAYYIQVTRPANNPEPGHIYGVELTYERRLDFLPGGLDGLSVIGNYTYTRSSKTQPYAWFSAPVLDDTGAFAGTQRRDLNIPDVPFAGQAAHSGTVGLGYAADRIEGRLSYTYQDRVRGGWVPNGLSEVVDAYGSLDGRLEYRFGVLGADSRLFIEGYDLLREADDAAQVSRVAGYVTNRAYYGGRQVRLGLSMAF